MFMKKISILLFTFLSFSQIKAQRVISFFNELKSTELVELFKDTNLIPNLQAIHGEIRMGTLDLTPERAGIVKKLNDAGVPVVAWVVLSEEDGYFSNSIKRISPTEINKVTKPCCNVCQMQKVSRN